MKNTTSLEAASAEKKVKLSLKAKSESKTSKSTTTTTAVAEEKVVKRRGRKKKEEVLAELITPVVEAPAPEKRRRGRPSKAETMARALQANLQEQREKSAETTTSVKLGRKAAQKTNDIPVSHLDEQAKQKKLALARSDSEFFGDDDLPEVELDDSGLDEEVTAVTLPAKRKKKVPPVVVEIDEEDDFFDDDDFDSELDSAKGKKDKKVKFDDFDDDFDEIVDDFDDLDDFADLLDDKPKKVDIPTEPVVVPQIRKVSLPKFKPRKLFGSAAKAASQEIDNVEATRSILAPYGLEPYMPAPGEPYMSEGMRKHLQTLLIRQREEIIARQEETIKILSRSGERHAEEADQVDENFEFELELRNREREARLRAKIDEALARLRDDPTFGYCKICGDKIGLRRLEARPTAELCIRCKDRQEIQERQFKVK